MGNGITWRKWVVGASVGMLMAVLIVWPVSYWYEIRVSWRVSGVYAVGVANGRVYAGYLTYATVLRPAPFGVAVWEADMTEDWDYLSWGEADPKVAAAGLGEKMTTLGVSWHHVGPGMAVLVMYIPLLFFAPVFLAAPGAVFISNWRKRKVRRKGLCAKCGYDLRTHGFGSKCPECGTQLFSLEEYYRRVMFKG